MRAARSTRRQVYPHSLSYQPNTFTRLPAAWVSPESNTQEAGWPMMSRETSGSVL